MFPEVIIIEVGRGRDTLRLARRFATTKLNGELSVAMRLKLNGELSVAIATLQRRNRQASASRIGELSVAVDRDAQLAVEIGRASCRERV